MAVDEVKGQVVRQAIRDLRRQIDTGRLKPGQILPAERQLCRSLEVSRMTLRSALEWLERGGAIERNHGRRQVALTHGPGPAMVVGDTVAMVTQISDPAQHPVREGLLAIDSGAIAAVQEASWHFLLLNPRSLHRYQIRQMLHHPPQGVSIGGITADYWEHRAWFAELIGHLPLAVNSDDPTWERCDRVISDHDRGAFELTNWLLARGCRRILPVIRHREDTNYWNRARMHGYRRAMNDAGVEALAPVMVENPPLTGVGDDRRFDYQRRLLAGHLVEWLRETPKVDALMAASDAEAIRIAAACRLLGLRPNEDMAIVGYDNFWPAAAERAWEPTVPLATVEKHNFHTGRELVRLLLDRIHGRLDPAPQLRLVPPNLVVCGEDAPAPDGGSPEAERRETGVEPSAQSSVEQERLAQ